MLSSSHSYVELELQFSGHKQRRVTVGLWAGGHKQPTETFLQCFPGDLDLRVLDTPPTVYDT